MNLLKATTYQHFQYAFEQNHLIFAFVFVYKYLAYLKDSIVAHLQSRIYHNRGGAEKPRL